MANKYVSSGDFAALVSQLQQSPEDPYLKQKVVKYLPYMQELAKKNPLALYHLAHVFPEKSAQHKNMIIKSAELGCTNAMLAACKFLVESKRPEDQQKAKLFLAKIEQSEDSFIMKHGQELAAKHPHLATAVQPAIVSNAATANHRFFTKAESKTQDVVLEKQNSYQMG
ncbi:hypothetical protein [Legionella saoudiensis]|uniref:hypothetical protein n=1 Tax=Legionella saoudiensis TaxID=1750561 RepID=UPI00122E0AC3|nr:hypothetical protein [Legionella saoudiensis]